MKEEGKLSSMEVRTSHQATSMEKEGSKLNEEGGGKTQKEGIENAEGFFFLQLNE